jgi:hypothetical protein
MTRQMIIQVFTGLLFLCFSNTSNWAQSKVKHDTDIAKQFIGVKFGDLSELSSNLEYGSCYMLDGHKYGLAVVRRGNVTMIWFERFLYRDSLKAHFEVIDVLTLPQIKKNQILVFGKCFYKGNERYDRKIVAIGEDSGTSNVDRIIRAWHVNFNTQRFESIPVENLRGTNEERMSY